MTEIKFGTDGWRAIIAKDYTVDNVMRVAEATARYVIQKNGSAIAIGHDCRFGGEMFVDCAIRVFGKFGVKTYAAKGFVSTPMISLAVIKKQAQMGVVITASHNPPSYNGFKLKSHFGGPTIPKNIAVVESMIPDDPPEILPEIGELEKKGLLEWVDFEQIYIDHLSEHFDLDLIRNAPFNIAYDAMYGAGQNVMRRLFPDAYLLHCDYNPSFMGRAPEPIHRNLGELSRALAESDHLHIGLANDGDADRVGMYDEDGNFVDSHHILLLLLLYLFKYKQLTGKIVVSFSVTDKLKDLAKQFGLECVITPIGFKYIAEIMTTDDVLVGGEESGGIAVKGHIPERDGVWIGLEIFEFMAKTGKSLKALVEDVYGMVGSFSFDRNDLHLTEAHKNKVVDCCKCGDYERFGNYEVTHCENIDGYKYYLGDDQWVMIRPSGTEPVLRVYAQGTDSEQVNAILDATRNTVMNL